MIPQLYEPILADDIISPKLSFSKQCTFKKIMYNNNNNNLKKVRIPKPNISNVLDTFM